MAITEDIRELLSERYSDRESYEMQEECELDEDAHYDSKGVDTFDQMAAWRHFENGLKKTSRYFSKMAGEILAGIFEGICRLQNRGRKAGHRRRRTGHSAEISVPRTCFSNQREAHYSLEEAGS